jgi:hypothetical protein
MIFYTTVAGPCRAWLATGEALALSADGLGSGGRRMGVPLADAWAVRFEAAVPVQRVQCTDEAVASVRL